MVDTHINTDVSIDEKVKKELISQLSLEKQVIVHCLYTCDHPQGGGIRIWPSTFLVDHASEHMCKLIHHENISQFPNWTLLKPNQKIKFTLIFTGLPHSCTKFDLIEHIPQQGGFEYFNIKRNKRDVYYITIK